MITKSKLANKFFCEGKYKEALDIYGILAGDMGEKLFLENMRLCKKKIKQQENLLYKNNNIDEDGEVVNIAYISDHNFAMPTYVSLFSLKVNRNKNNKYKIFLFAIEFSDNEKLEFRLLSEENFCVEVIDVPNEYGKFEINKPGFHVSPSAILKFRLPHLLTNIDKVLYIDGDTIINKDVYDIYTINLEDKFAGVVEDIKPKYHYNPSMLVKLKIENHRGYFNSGVLLLNLKQMRIEEVTGKLMDYRENGINYFMDQDALNVVFEDRVKYFSCLFNFLVTFPESFKIDEMKNNYKDIDNCLSFKDIFEKSYITHFASKNKPWKVRGIRFGEYWGRYYLRSGAYKSKFFVEHEIKKFLMEKEIVVSFTSFPGRVNLIRETIESLLRQIYKPNKIILWLAREQFPRGEADLPDYLKSLDEDHFFIKWCEDIRSYKKLIPSLRIFDDSVIITCDDDVIYDEHWLLELVAEYLKDNENIHCHRGHEIKLNSIGMPLQYKKWPRNIKKEICRIEISLLAAVEYCIHPKLLMREFWIQRNFQKYALMGMIYGFGG